MRTITELLHKIEVQEKTVEKIGIFLKTKKGQMFVSKLYTMSLKELCDRYNAPRFLRLYKSDRKNKNLIKAAIKKYQVNIPVYKPLIQEKTIRVKCPVRLTRKELREIDARRPKKLGFAARMHAYEEHKLKKFENNLPTKEAVKQDIFSKELEAQINTQLYIRREYIRNFLSRVYYKVNKRESFYRLFMVYENKVIPGKIYEKEGDPYVVGYPFANCNEKTSIETLKNILRQRAKTIRDKECVELKLYTKYGILLASSKT